MPDIIEMSQFAVKNLVHQGLRSYLTLIGVIIGIAAIVTFVSLGDGLHTAVIDQFEQLGSNTLFIAPGSTSVTGGNRNQTSTVITLEQADIDKIKNIAEISDVIAPVTATGSIGFGREKVNGAIFGMDPKEIVNIGDTGFMEIGEGRNLESNDVFTTVIGYTMATDVFDKEIKLRDKIEVQGRFFKVVGITKENSQSFGSGPNVNTAIFIPEKGFKQLFPDAQPTFLLVKTHTKNDVQNAQKKVERILEQRYGKDQKDCQVVTSEQILESIAQVLGVIQIFLVGIASISLIVGGIGIMNTMVMAVMERTAEIGVMKAIGATNSLILSIFILEAGFIGLIGGAIGVGIGYLAAFGIGAIAESSGLALKVALDPYLVVGALVFSMAVGMVSGAYPARRAAMLDPVDALRHGI